MKYFINLSANGFISKRKEYVLFCYEFYRFIEIIVDSEWVIQTIMITIKTMKSANCFFKTLI